MLQDCRPLYIVFCFCPRTKTRRAREPQCSMQRPIAKSRYLLSVILFSLSTILSAILLLIDKQFAAFGLLCGQTGFFIFVVSDRLEQAATLEHLELNLNEILPALMLAKAAGDDSSSVLYRLTESEAVAYTIAKIAQARRLYNTCFSK